MGTFRVFGGIAAAAANKGSFHTAGPVKEHFRPL
jgi:hypothetical protein